RVAHGRLSDPPTWGGYQHAAGEGDSRFSASPWPVRGGGLRVAGDIFVDSAPRSGSLVPRVRAPRGSQPPKPAAGPPAVAARFPRERPRVMKTMLSALSLSLLLGVTLPARADIMTPSTLNPGDQFRVIFVSSGTRDATSSTIADYDTFITNLANAAGLTYN